MLFLRLLVGHDFRPFKSDLARVEPIADVDWTDLSMSAEFCKAHSLVVFRLVSTGNCRWAPRGFVANRFYLHVVLNQTDFS